MAVCNMPSNTRTLQACRSASRAAVLTRHGVHSLKQTVAGGKQQRAPPNRLAQCRAAELATSAPAPTTAIPQRPSSGHIIVHGVHHVALICADLEASLAFYTGVLGLEINPDRPHHKLPYRGAWLWIGPEMIHLMELPNPDPSDAASRPQHGGRDRHFCIGVASLEPLISKLDGAGVPYTRSASGRPAVFFRDPDANVIECVEGIAPWR